MPKEEKHEAMGSLIATGHRFCDRRSWTCVWCASVAGFAGLLGSTDALAEPGDWINFADHTCRVVADPATFSDIPCDATCCAEGCTGSGSGDGIDPTCHACEKDLAVGDFDRNGFIDLVIVRKQPFYAVGGKSNLLFLNQGGTMVDRSDLVPGFRDATDDRDVAVIDVNSDELLDIVTAGTFGERPRVYLNRGCGPPACGGSCPEGGTWCGLQFSHSFPSFDPPPFFCAVGAGDINGDGCPDLYFADYSFAGPQQTARLFDRLLVNTKDTQTGACKGVFEDQTQQRICSGFDPGTPCFTESMFTTGAQIVDLDGNGCNDIIKTEAGRVSVIYNNDECTGNFVAASVSPLVTDEPAYMSMAGDLNNNGLLDMYVVSDADDFYRVNLGGGEFSENVAVANSPKVDNVGGNIWMADLDADGDRDVIVSDADVDIASCARRLAILRTDVDAKTSEIIAIADPLGSGIRPWNTQGTYDAVVFPLTPSGPLALWAATCSGNQLFIKDGAPGQCGTSPSAAIQPHDLRKNRFISFDPANQDPVAFRVQLLEAACNASGEPCRDDGDCLPLESCVQEPPVMLGWVGDPFEPDTDRTPAGTFTSLVVKDLPPARVWTEEVIHLSGCEIGPARTYDISATVRGLQFSEPLIIRTTDKPEGKFWGDVVGEFDGTAWTAANGLVNVNDVISMIAFLSLRPAPHITVLDLAGEAPNFLINATDLTLLLQAFQGRTYPPPPFPHQGSPADCP